MNDGIDKIIGEIAKQHHVVFSKDDPMMIMVTLCKLVMQEHNEQLQSDLEKTRKEISLLSAEQVMNAQKISEKFITEAANYLSQRAKSSNLIIAKEIAKSFDEKLDEIKNQTITAEKAASSSKKWALVTAAIALASIGFLIGIAV